MNPTSRRRHPYARLVAAASIVVMCSFVTRHAYAWSPFGTADERVKQVFCDMGSVKGTFTMSDATYRTSGACVQLESPRKGNDSTRNISEFPRVNESREIFRASWTGQGGYNPQTKETWEKVSMPAPTIDQKTPAGRPYGNYESRMICASDPWLTGTSVKCTGKTVIATGNLGDLEAALRQIDRPVTTPGKQPQLQALNAAHDQYVRAHSFTSSTTNSAKVAALFVPDIVEPKAGSVHRPQTAMAIRVAAGSAKDTAYEIELQVRAGQDWRALTNIAASAAVAQSAIGYRGWGAHVDGTGPQMTAMIGTYRVRARTTAPRPSAPGEWVEFRIDGQPGVSIQDLARTKVDKIGGPTAVKAAVGTTAVEAPRTNSHEVPAPAGSGTTRRPVTPLAVRAPTELVNKKADAVLLNPQPLPPSVVAPAQVPSALR